MKRERTKLKMKREKGEGGEGRGNRERRNMNGKERLGGQRARGMVGSILFNSFETNLQNSINQEIIVESASFLPIVQQVWSYQQEQLLNAQFRIYKLILSIIFLLYSLPQYPLHSSTSTS